MPASRGPEGSSNNNNPEIGYSSALSSPTTAAEKQTAVKLGEAAVTLATQNNG
jgi:hypothetical protein